MHLARSHAICCLTQAHALQVKRRVRKEPQRLAYALATPMLVTMEVGDKTKPAQFKMKTNASNFIKREVQDKNNAGGADAVTDTPQIAVCNTCMKVFKSIHARNGHKKHCKTKIVEGEANVAPKTEAFDKSSMDAVAGLLAMEAELPKRGKVKSGERVVRLAKSVNGAMHKGARGTQKLKGSKSKILLKGFRSKKTLLCPCNAYHERKGQRVSRSVSHVISFCDRPISR